MLFSEGFFLREDQIKPIELNVIDVDGGNVFGQVLLSFGGFKYVGEQSFAKHSERRLEYP